MIYKLSSYWDIIYQVIIVFSLKLQHLNKIKKNFRFERQYARTTPEVLSQVGQKKLPSRCLQPIQNGGDQRLSCVTKSIWCFAEACCLWTRVIVSCVKISTIPINQIDYHLSIRDTVNFGGHFHNFSINLQKLAKIPFLILLFSSADLCSFAFPLLVLPTTREHSGFVRGIQQM